MSAVSHGSGVYVAQNGKSRVTVETCRLEQTRAQNGKSPPAEQDTCHLIRIDKINIQKRECCMIAHLLSYSFHILTLSSSLKLKDFIS